MMRLTKEHVAVLKNALGQLEDVVDALNEIRDILHKAQVSRKSPYHGAEIYESRLQAIITLLFSIKDNMEIEASGLHRQTWLWSCNQAEGQEDPIMLYKQMLDKT